MYLLSEKPIRPQIIEHASDANNAIKQVCVGTTQRENERNKWREREKLRVCACASEREIERKSEKKESEREPGSESEDETERERARRDRERRHYKCKFTRRMLPCHMPSSPSYWWGVTPDPYSLHPDL